MESVPPTSFTPTVSVYMKQGSFVWRYIPAKIHVPYFTLWLCYSALFNLGFLQIRPV